MTFHNTWKLRIQVRIFVATLTAVLIASSASVFPRCSAFVPPVTSHTKSTSISKSKSKLFLQWEDIVYSAEAAAASLATNSLDHVSLTTIPVMYGAGLLTSVSPCVWGLLPLTMSYITTAAGERNDKNPTIPTLVFAAGLASVFMTFGVIAATAGTLFGGGPSTPLGLLSNLISLAMGLQLLELLQIPLPSINNIFQSSSSSSSTKDLILLDASGNILSSTTSTTGNANSGSLVRTFLLGASSAVVASPCATPVLTSILAFCTAHHPAVGAGLLGMYSLGYSTPLLVVAATGGQVFRGAPWVTQLTGGVLVCLGTQGILTALLGDASLAGLEIIEY